MLYRLFSENPGLIWTYLILNVVVCAVYAYDKLASKTGNVKLRIPEKTLLTLAVIGPFGAYAGMEIFRHKTKHQTFKILVPVCCALHVLLFFFEI